MSNVLNHFGFAVYGKRTPKPKRTTEYLMGIREDGVMIHHGSCLPSERVSAVQKMFDTYSKVYAVNVVTIRGRSLVRYRQSANTVRSEDSNLQENNQP